MTTPNYKPDTRYELVDTDIINDKKYRDEAYMLISNIIVSTLN